MRPASQQLVAKDVRHDFTNSDFDGVNTQASRFQIQEGEQSWLENLIPIGNGNAAIVPGISAALAAIGQTPYYAKCFNISGSDYLFVATTPGNIYQIGDLSTSTFTVTQVSTGGNAGKFTKCQMAQWQNTTIVIVDGVNGYYDYTAGALTKGTTYAPVGARPAFSTGTCIATFSGRVWVASGRTIYFSNLLGSVVAGSSGLSYNDWTLAGGGLGGSFVLTDETLHGNVVQLDAQNNFLYIIGADSVFVISDVQVVGGVTVYTKTDLSTGIGTSYPLSLCNYFRTLWWANSSGFFGLYGTTARKGSDALDGVFSSFPDLLQTATPPAPGGIPSCTAGLVTINNTVCLAFLVDYADPIQLITRPLLCLYFNKKWFFASQGPTSGSASLTMIVGGLVRGANLLYGLDTNGNLYQLFEDEEASIDFVWQTALWPFGAPIAVKQSIRAGFGAVVNSAVMLDVGVTIDSEIAQNSFSVTGGSEIAFYGVGPITFIGAASVAITFLSSGYIFFQGPASNFGRFLGLTFSGTGGKTTFTMAALQYSPNGATWGGS